MEAGDFETARAYSAINHATLSPVVQYLNPFVEAGSKVKRF